MWALKKLNLDRDVTLSQIFNESNELDGFQLKAYKSSALYKETKKRYHDKPIEKHEFAPSYLLKFKLTGPFKVVQLFSHGAVELENEEGTRFKVNGRRIKEYLSQMEEEKEVIEEWDLDEV
ncbi:uncharacterized protein [Solanum tuberosum]|uniref:uncharacterized protein n=1 Tax=Solanum tuberosum TaxID=4113 RepID=UPI000739FB43|nr:PREDICTED: uncharacterized protein LOC107061725 [Solanum tuberosum]